jgi:hypothetical protein
MIPSCLLACLLAADCTFVSHSTERELKSVKEKTEDVGPFGRCSSRNNEFSVQVLGQFFPPLLPHFTNEDYCIIIYVGFFLSQF